MWVFRNSLYYDKPIVAKELSGPFGLLHIALIAVTPIIMVNHSGIIGNHNWHDSQVKP